MYFGVKKSGISMFLVSAENGAGVNQKTNITYEQDINFLFTVSVLRVVQCGIVEIS